MTAFLHRLLPLSLAFLRKNKHYLLAFLWVGAIALAYAFSLTVLGVLAIVLPCVLALCCLLRIYKRFAAVIT